MCLECWPFLWSTFVVVWDFKEPVFGLDFLFWFAYLKKAFGFSLTDLTTFSSLFASALVSRDWISLFILASFVCFLSLSLSLKCTLLVSNCLLILLLDCSSLFNLLFGLLALYLHYTWVHLLLWLPQ